MSALPTGTVTFLFTDIEGSTRLAQAHPETWESLHRRHDALLQSALAAHQGYVFQIVGDALCAAFQSASDAINAALDSQRQLQAENWGEKPVRVRMGLHTGEAALLENGDYLGYLALSRVQRLMSAGHGGQVLISQATQELVRDDLPEGVTLRDMGERRLKDLIRPEHIYQLVTTDLPADFPPLKTLEAYRHNLPAQTTSFIGREREIKEIKEALSHQRLITLTGSGGTGKTRLSLQVAADLLDAFPDGVWFVELAALADPELIPQTILAALDIPEQSDKSALAVLENYLKTRATLIVLDNCEHLILAASRVTQAILNAAPSLKMLASSREALGIPGELAWPVPSLSVPDPKKLPHLDQLTQYEAVRLFIERAVLVNPHFDVNRDNAPAIAQVCYRLDGIPLAIELAAARVKMLSVEQISSRLDDRFRLLTGGARTALPRQQTLRALIDWSYDLLSENERLLLRRLAVFMGSWTLEIAEQVCSDEKIEQYEVLDLLGRLVDKSLVATNEGRSTLRYRILETVRQYAREKLFESGEGEAIRDRHLKVFLELAEQAEPKIRSADQLVWLDRLEDEIDNLRAALEWSQERDVEACLRLTGALWRFWDLRGYNADAMEWFHNSIILSEGLHTVPRARVLSRACLFYRNAVEEEKTLRVAQAASKLAREVNDKASLALALGIEGEAIIADNPERAQKLLDEALSICEELKDHWLACPIWWSLALIASIQNNQELQLSLTEKGLQEARLSGDNRRISRGLADLGFLYLDQGKPLQAEKAISEGLTFAWQIGDKDNVAERSMNLALVDIYLEKFSEAETLLIESRRAFEEIGHYFYLTAIIVNLGYLAWIKDDIAQFTEYAADALRIAKQGESLPAIAFATWASGLAAIFNGQAETAEDQLTDALNTFWKRQIKSGYGSCIIGFGMLAVAIGKMERAAQILGAYQQLLPSLGAIDPFMTRKMEQHIAITREQLGPEAFEIAFQRGKAMTIEQVIEFSLQKD